MSTEGNEYLPLPSSESFVQAPMSVWRAIGHEAYEATDRLNIKRLPRKQTLQGETYDTWSARWYDADSKTLYRLVVREQEDKPGPATLSIINTATPGEPYPYTRYTFYPNPLAADDDAEITPDNSDPNIDGYLLRQQGTIDPRKPQTARPQNTDLEEPPTPPTPNDVQELLDNIRLHKNYRTQLG